VVAVSFEAGAVASAFGAPFSVVSGGLGCLIATGWVAASTPMIRRYRGGARTDELIGRKSMKGKRV